MPGNIDEFDKAELADIEHLARSPNRVRVLDALADGPATRRELEDATGVVRAIIGRALLAFEDRSWVKRCTGGTFTATPAGARIAADFAPFI